MTSLTCFFTLWLSKTSCAATIATVNVHLERWRFVLDSREMDGRGELGYSSAGTIAGMFREDSPLCTYLKKGNYYILLNEGANYKGVCEAH